MGHGRAHSTPYAGDLLIFAPQNPIAHGNITPTTSTKKAPGKDFCVPNHTLPPLPPFRCATQVIPWAQQAHTTECLVHLPYTSLHFPQKLPSRHPYFAPQHVPAGSTAHKTRHLKPFKPCSVTAPQQRDDTAKAHPTQHVRRALGYAAHVALEP